MAFDYSHKICHVLSLVDNGNAINKGYMLQSMQILKDRQNKIERLMITKKTYGLYSEMSFKK
jgi:hypothetical protein